MAILRGLVGAFALFAAAFALHIVGGVTDQDWLFAIAVVLIALCAVGYPVLAMLIGRPHTNRDRLVLTVAGAAIGASLTAATLWAANDRGWAWWHIPAAVVVSVTVAAIAYWFSLAPFRPGRESPSTG